MVIFNSIRTQQLLQLFSLSLLFCSSSVLTMKRPAEETTQEQLDTASKARNTTAQSTNEPATTTTTTTTTTSNTEKKDPIAQQPKPKFRSFKSINQTEYEASDGNLLKGYNLQIFSSLRMLCACLRMHIEVKNRPTQTMIHLMIGSKLMKLWMLQ